MFSSIQNNSTTPILTENFYKELQQHPDKKKHAHYPLCIGYRKPVNSSQVLVTVKALMRYVDNLTLYFAPKDDDAFETFKNHNIELFKLIENGNSKCKITTTTEAGWRKTSPIREAAEEKYDNFLEKSGEKTQRLASENLDKDTERYADNLEKEKARIHCRACAVDVVAFAMHVADINFLIYPDSLSETMHHAITNMHNILKVEMSALNFYRLNPKIKSVEGKIKVSEINTKPNNPELDSNQIANAVEHVLVTCYSNQICPDYTGKVLASFYGSLAFNEKINHDPRVFGKQQPPKQIKPSYPVNQTIDDLDDGEINLRKIKTSA